MRTRPRPHSPEAQRHADWLGMLQPEGLVVSIAVLEEQGVYVRQPPALQERLAELCPDELLPSREAFFRLATRVLEWPEPYFERRPEALLPWRLELSELGTTLQPDAVLTDPKGIPLLFVLWSDTDPDAPRSDARWPASPQERFERLLTELQATGASLQSPGASLQSPGSPPNDAPELPSGPPPTRCPGPPIGVHVWKKGIRLTYAPAGEAPGSLTFPLEALLTVDGRLLIDALVMLLGKARLFTAQKDARLRPLLEQSRKRQEKVTTALASQVEEALALLVAGMDAASQRSGGTCLRGLEHDGDGEQLYRGLITVLLRLVFLFYAEDRNLLPMDHPVYANHYALSGLADRLQEDRLRHPQAMDRRFGAWARLLALFRLVYAGAHWPGVRDAQGQLVREGLTIPAREGELFDPDTYPFLEGRPTGSRWTTDPAQVPPVDDGVVEAVLSRLIHLEGQRLSYRNLDVEQIGSVYESLMGFSLKRALGTAIALRPEGRVIDLAELQASDDPLRFLAKSTGLKAEELREKIPALAGLSVSAGMSSTPARKGKESPSSLPLFAGLRPTPSVASAAPETSGLLDEGQWLSLLEPLRPRNGALYRPGEHYLQPGEDRRKTGSHYTPRSLTERIVRRTLKPVLFGHPGGGSARARVPTAEGILALKVCDPAMGSGAFLAEACRYLSARLVEAWSREGSFPAETRGTDPLVVARRLVAEHCLFGVDKNPFAVNLARLSLWLITLARDLPFTFVDHALKEGDSVIGLSFEEIMGSYRLWSAQEQLFQIDQKLKRAVADRAEILNRADYRHKRRFLDEADADVARERVLGDLWLAHHWKGGKQKEQKERLTWFMWDSQRWYNSRTPVAELPPKLSSLRAELPMRPFHWSLEFPEVFLRENPGFDAVVGNPPFGGRETIHRANGGEAYTALLSQLYASSQGKADLAAYFFLRSAGLLRTQGCFGLVATNSIKQGATRLTGLQTLLERGLELYAAEVDQPWEQGAAVIVDVVHACQGRWSGSRWLGQTPVQALNSMLQGEAENEEPKPLKERKGQCYKGVEINGKGFLVEPQEYQRLLALDPANAQILRPYIGGEELNSNVPPSVDAPIPVSRYVIDFGQRTLEECEQWPLLISHLRSTVFVERQANSDPKLRAHWWQFKRSRPELYAAISNCVHCYAISKVTKHLLFYLQPVDRIFSDATVIFSIEGFTIFALLQSQVHEHWARTMGSSMKTDLRYTPSTCFETFPFPRVGDAGMRALERAGEALYVKRSEVMVSRQQGMTKVWNGVVDPDCLDADIVALRKLRDAMDQAVLDAYGWGSWMPPTATAL